MVDHQQSNFIYTDEPEFIEAMPNVTVALGRDARISCKVRNLGTYQVNIEQLIY